MAGNDCTVAVGNGMLNVRVGAVIIKNGKFLMVRCRSADYLYSVGGRIKFGETAEEAVVREVKEETGTELEIDRLGFIYENFFYLKDGCRSLKKDKLIYEIAFIYYMRVPDDFEPVEANCKENGDAEMLEWISPDDDVKFYPEFFRTELFGSDKSIKHFVSDNRRK